MYYWSLWLKEIYIHNTIYEVEKCHEFYDTVLNLSKL